MKPTVRDIKVALNGSGIDLDKNPVGWTYNDKRKHGYRIKLWGFTIPEEKLKQVERLLTQMFPQWEFKVYLFKPQAPSFIKSIRLSLCIKCEPQVKFQ